MMGASPLLHSLVMELASLSDYWMDIYKCTLARLENGPQRSTQKFLEYSLQLIIYERYWKLEFSPEYDGRSGPWGPLLPETNLTF